MRPALEASPDPWRHSATPIYDALYAEYRRLFRSLPGDRSDEEDLGFVAFGNGPPAAPRPDQRRPRARAWEPSTGGLHYYRHPPPGALPPGQRDGRY